MTRSPNRIAILMATYNGAKYLREQIDSLFAQTCQDWHLFIHDDGSSDDTMSIVNQYIETHPDKITILDYPSQGGACKNFLSMLEQVDSSYYTFCDQDDVWLPEKIEKAFECIRMIESQTPDIPVVINTDLTVVDSNKNVIAPSFWEYENIYPSWIRSYDDHAALHYVTGCTMLFNKKAKEVTKRPYNRATMHDTWIALSTIAARGTIHNLCDSYILYRQHGENTLGAKDAKVQTFYFKLQHFREVLRLNINHFKEINAIREISIADYIIAKIRYRRFVLDKTKKRT